MAEGKDLLQVLWSGADVLRGKMDANEYKTYLLGLVFYKYLSDSYLAKVYDLIKDKNPESLEEAQCVYEDAMKSDDAEELLCFWSPVPSRFEYKSTSANRPLNNSSDSSIRLKAACSFSLLKELFLAAFNILIYVMSGSSV